MCDFDIMERKDSNTYMTNYVRLCYVAQYENRKLLEELLNFKTSQNNVCAKSLNHKLRHYLEKEENDLLFDCVNSNSFSKLNQRVLYLVLSNSDLVDPPSNGWNGTSSTTETIGDCVKLIQQKYDLTFNKGNTKFTDEQVKTLFSLFKDIAGKFEHWLQKNEGELVLRYDQIQSCCFDIEMRTKYREHLHLLESRLIDSNQPGKHPDTYDTDSTQLSTEVTNTMRVTYVFQVVLVEIFQKYMASLISPAKFRTKTSNNLQLYHSLPKHLEDFRIINNQSKNVDAILRETIIIKSRANARMTDSEMVEHFRFLKRIVKDLEEKMKEKMYLPNGKLVAELKYYKTCCMDDQISTWYHESLIDLAEREYHFGTSIHFPDTERTTRFWYINHVSEDTLQGLTRDDPVSKYVLIGYAFEEKLSKTIGELLSICVPHCLLFSKLFCAQNFEYFNAEEYLLFFESQKNGYIDFNTVLLSSVMLCLKKTKVYKFLKHINEKKKNLMNREKKELNEKEMRQYLRSFKGLETLYLRPKRKYDSLIEQLENLLMEEEQLKVLFASLVEKKKKHQPIWMRSKRAKQIPSSSLLDSKEFYELLANGCYLSYDNRVYLGGPCNSGKTSLAYIFIGKEAPATWDSTNGLEIYFGQNGIHLKDRKMIPIPKGMLCNRVNSKVISAINEMQKEEEATNLVVEIDDKNENGKKILDADLKEDGSFHNLELKEIVNTDSQSDIKDKLVITKRVSMQTQKLDDNPFGESKSSDSEIFKTQSHIPEPSPKALTVIQEEVLHKHILDEVRSGEYNLEIAPSDIVDFGGQKAFDMTHQLFILQEGTVLLLFDGSKDLDKHLPEYHKEKISSADILLHWVGSVSKYCTIECGMQRIQFVATHSDRYKDNLEIRRTELVTQLTEIFQYHEQRSYLYFKNLFFIDARDKDDTEIDKLKHELVKIAFSQKSWGKKTPLIWIPLEKQIVDLKLQGTSILRIEEIQTLNKSNEDLMMDDEKLKFFLRTQHAIGKFVFFDQGELAKFVIIEPSVLVNALRSFVTDEMFFPSKDPKRYQILENLQKNGMLKKDDLETLWYQEKSIFQYKEFIAKILLHMDILVVAPTQFKEYYIVPCMIKTNVNNDYAKKYLNAERSICMAYVFKEQMVPPCFLFRLIAFAVRTWPLKKYQEALMFYQDIATFALDKNNDFSLITKGRKILVYFTNENSIRNIQKPTVARVQKDLTMEIELIVEFYQHYPRNIHSFDMAMVQKPFELEYDETSKTPCFVKREEELKLSKNGQSYEADSKKTQTKTPKKTFSTIGGRGVETIVEYNSLSNMPIRQGPLKSVPLSLLTQDGNTEHKGSHVLFKHEVLCDGLFVDCIVDKRMNMRVNVDKDDCKNRLIECESLYNRHLLLKTRVDNKCYQLNKVREEFIDAIQHKDSLLLRHILAYWNLFNSDILFLIQMLELSIKTQCACCAKAIAWKITRLFMKEVAVSEYCDIWPGFRCACTNEYVLHGGDSFNFCSPDVVIIVEISAKANQCQLNSFYGIPIRYEKQFGNSQEGKLITEKIASSQDEDSKWVSKVTGISDSRAKHYFALHRKLSVISPSPIKSKGYPLKQECFKRPCIQLYCRLKGYIPVGEAHYPSEIDGIPTDILQGYAEMLVEDIRIGSKVGGSGGGTGTLGGFVRYLGKDAFLTCAHVIIDKNNLVTRENRKKIHENPITVYYKNQGPDPSVGGECGELMAFAFPPDNSNGVHVDAAIIQIDKNRVKINNDIILLDGNRTPKSIKDIGMFSPYLNVCCLDYTDVGTDFLLTTRSCGSVSGLQECPNIKVTKEEERSIKYKTLTESVTQMRNQNPKPIDISEYVHFVDQVQKVEDAEDKSPSKITFCNQISFLNVAFQPGDSGTCIYVSCTSGKSGCIGMAIASHPGGGCIVTPMKAILSALRIL